MKKIFLLLLLSITFLQGQTRSEIQPQIDAIATGVPNTALKVRTILNTLANGVAQTGDIKEIDVSTAYIASNFDVTGLGTNERLGWAICNGNNWTRNRNKRVAVQYDPSDATYSTLGATGGESAHVLTESEIPSHTHNTVASSGTTVLHSESLYFNREGNTWSASGTTDVKSSGISSTGGGLPHNNMQPYIVTLFIMKL